MEERIIEEKTINTNNTYNTAHKTTAREDYTLSKEIYSDIKSSQDEALKAKEEASKARIDNYTTEKASEQTKMYEEFMDESIKKQFKMQTELQSEILRLERKKAETEIELEKKIAKADIEIEKKYNKAKLDLEELEKNHGQMKKDKTFMMAWRIFWPTLGFVIGAITFILMYLIK